MKETRLQASLRTRVLLYNFPYLPFICGTVIAVQVVGIGLRRRFGVWVVEEILDSEEDLSDGDSWSPRLLLIEDRKADRSGWIYIGMEKRWDEFACGQHQVSYLRFTKERKQSGPDTKSETYTWEASWGILQ